MGIEVFLSVYAGFGLTAKAMVNRLGSCLKLDNLNPMKQLSAGMEAMAAPGFLLRVPAPLPGTAPGSGAGLESPGLPQQHPVLVKTTLTRHRQVVVIVPDQDAKPITVSQPGPVNTT